MQYQQQQGGYQQNGYQQPGQPGGPIVFLDENVQVNVYNGPPMGYQGGYQLGNALNYLDSCPSVYIMQKMEWIESVCGFEVPSTFHVYQGNQQGDKMGERPLFRVKEKSSCCARLCLPTDCRPFELKVHQYTGEVTKKNQNEYKDDKKLVFKAERPYACTFYCINRPFMTVHHKENGINEYIGKIRAPFNFCNYAIEVYDKTDNLIYIVEASCCQAIFWIDMPCKSCQTAKFIVFNPAKEPLVELWKESQGCCKACLSNNGDSFRVLFPPGATKEQKALLVTAAVFLDYRYFEKNQNTESDLDSN